MSTSPVLLFGDVALQRAMMDLANNSAVRVMKPSISKALDPVKRQAKANVSTNKRSGALQRAIGKKTGRKRNKLKVWGKVYVRSKPQEWNGKRINPVKYAHLLEFGTTHSRAFPFLRRAMSATRGTVNQVLIREGWLNMKKFAGKLRRKHGTLRALKLAGRISRGSQ